jgi:hypothetical protein
MPIARILTIPLVLSALTAQAQIVLEVEPNNVPAQAQPISPGQHIRASFNGAADEEWFSFTLTAPGQVHLRSLNAGTLSQSTARDTRIGLYDATGTTRLAWDDDGGFLVAAHCGATVPAGSYLWRVNWRAGTVLAPYDLDFFVSPGRPIDTAEAAEPNDPRLPGGVSTPMALGDTVEGTLTAGDADFWSFTLANSGTVKIASLDDGGVPQLDLLGLRFYQESTPGNWVGISFNWTDPFSHRIELSASLQPGTYAVAVTSLGAGGTGPWAAAGVGRYSLRTELVGVTPPVYFASTTSAQPSSNACVGSNGLRPRLGHMPGETCVFDSTFVTRIENTLPFAFAGIMLGLSNTTALGGTVPLPALLDNGAQGSQCLVRVDPEVLVLVVLQTDAGGSGEFSYRIPFAASLLGTRLFEQALCADPTLNATGFSVSNDASFVLGESF